STPSSSPVNGGSRPSQPGGASALRLPRGDSSSDTITVYQRPDFTGNTPPPGAAPRVEMSRDGSSSQKVTVYQRPDLSGNIPQPAQGQGGQPGRGLGNNDFNRGSGGRSGSQSSPS